CSSTSSESWPPRLRRYGPTPPPTGVSNSQPMILSTIQPGMTLERVRALAPFGDQSVEEGVRGHGLLIPEARTRLLVLVQGVARADHQTVAGEPGERIIVENYQPLCEAVRSSRMEEERPQSLQHRSRYRSTDCELALLEKKGAIACSEALILARQENARALYRLPRPPCVPLEPFEQVRACDPAERAVQRAHR